MRNKILIATACLILSVAVCGCETDKSSKEVIGQYENSGENNANDVPSKNLTESKKASDVMNTAVIPEEYRYMFDSSSCEGELPDNSLIKRIALSKYNGPQGDNGHKLVVYALVDLENGKLFYGMSSSSESIKIVQEIDLSDAEILSYKDAVNAECLKNPIEADTAFWKMAIEYEDGTCYSYEFSKEGYMEGTPTNKMIKTFFTKMDLKDSEKKILGVW